MGSPAPVLLAAPAAALAADRACAPAHPGYRALLAETHGQVIGLAEYDTAGEKDDAEISIAVCDGLHHRRVGTLLVEHRVSAARADGVTTFTADALSENRGILRLFADRGAVRLVSGRRRRRSRRLAPPADGRQSRG